MDYQEALQKFKERRQQIYKDKIAGLSYSKLAKKYNITSQRAYEIVKKEKNAKAY